MLTTRSVDDFCLSTSMCAPETSRIALMLEPPRPITRLIRFADTIIFLDLKQYLKWVVIPWMKWLVIYTTKIDEFVCPPNISETIAVRIMKLAHGARVASTTIKLISKPILLKTIQRIGAEYPKHRPDKHARQGAAVWQINLYYIIFTTYPYVLLWRIELWWAHILITFIYIITPLLTSTQSHISPC